LTVLPGLLLIADIARRMAEILSASRDAAPQS
jgi:hypothetical protein